METVLMSESLVVSSDVEETVTEVVPSRVEETVTEVLKQFAQLVGRWLAGWNVTGITPTKGGVHSEVLGRILDQVEESSQRARFFFKLRSSLSVLLTTNPMSL